MAIAYVNSAFNYLSTPGTSDSFAYSVASGSNRGLLFFVWTNGTGGDIVTAVSYNSVAATKVNSVNISGNQYISTWRLVAPATGSNTVSVTTSASTEIETHVQEYTDLDQTNFIDSFNNGTATGNLTLSTTVVNSNCWLASATRNTSFGGMGAGTGTTIRVTGTLYNSGDSNGTVSTGSQSMGWTAASGTSGGVIVSLKPVVAAATAKNLLLTGVGQ